jgi:hypothetical protein
MYTFPLLVTSYININKQVFYLFSQAPNSIFAKTNQPVSLGY